MFNQILSDGNFFLEKDGFTYSLCDKSYIKELHHNKNATPPDSIYSHVIKTKFLNSNKSTVIKPLDTSSFYFNYFIGEDKSKWKTKVRSSSKILYENLYDNINLLVYHNYSQNKYDFIVKPLGDPQSIKISYEGADGVYLKNGNLVVENTINTFKEVAPYSYQIINDEKVTVPCNYQLKEMVLTYEFPEGYDKSKELIIDPVVVFSTYSGSTADNFGFTATYDKDENTYAGGIVFGQGVYPSTTGAYKTSFNTSRWFYVDIAISKFNVTGSNLLYSTYLGGSRSEAPHSMVVNDKNELFLMGTSGSSNYPITSGSYKSNFSGGAIVSPRYSGVYYFHGCDIVVTKFNSSGTALLGSTYLGGTGNDGLNTNSSLMYNYGDAFRGEIILDLNNNVVVTSTTNSTDFPTTIGAPQTLYGGGFSDACVFTLDSNLQNLLWSTYYGGSNADGGYGLQRDSKNNIFITGGTISNDLLITSGAFDSIHNGLEDGFIAKFNPVTNSILSSTYLGTSNYDQSFMIQIDVNDEVYVVGQSLGNYQVSSSVYSNPNSSQFLHKLSNDLSSSFWSTVIGSGRASVDLSPSAFLVNDCGLIYLSGWGGVANNYYRSNSSSTSNLPITSDAFQSTTDGSDFYLMVLDRDAASLKYGTYYGGNISHEHVDGGTSRFDKKGNVYQSICAGCGGNSDLPTTAGAWSRTNNASNCNLGVIKMNIAYINSIASAPFPKICLPDSVSFTNKSSGGNTFKWYFGDGDSSSLFEPIHVYLDTGTYKVTLIVSDSFNCVLPDTSLVLVKAYYPKKLKIKSVPMICRGDSIQLIAQNGNNFKWSPSSSLTNDTVFDPIAFPASTTVYRLISDFYCNSDTIYDTVFVDSTRVVIGPDTGICKGSSVNLQASGGGSYVWSPSTGLSSTTVSNPVATPIQSTNYQVTVTSTNGCVFQDSVEITVYQDSMSIISDTGICKGSSVNLQTSGGGSYVRSPNTGLSFATISNPVATPIKTTNYQVTVTSTNGCVFQDSVEITVYQDSMSIISDTGICKGSSVNLKASGGGSYVWSPSTGLSSTTVSNPVATPTQTTNYQVTVTSTNGCVFQDSVEITVYQDSMSIISDTGKCKGSSVNLQASGGGSYVWSPSTGLSSATVSNPVATPTQTANYQVTVTSFNGCVFQDSVEITVYQDSMSIISDTGICKGSSVNLQASGGGSYVWSPSTGLSSTTVSNPVATPTKTTSYQVTVTSTNGCVLKDSVKIALFDESHTISQNTSICQGDTTNLLVSGGDSYFWSPPVYLSDSSISNPLAYPLNTTVYKVTITTNNNCLVTDSVTVFVDTNRIYSQLTYDTTICINDSVVLEAFGGDEYSWTPIILVTPANQSSTKVSPKLDTYFYVEVSNYCFTKMDSVLVKVAGDKPIEIPNDTICRGEEIEIFARGGVVYNWDSHPSILSGLNSFRILASPSKPTVYQVEITDLFNCSLKSTANIEIFPDPVVDAGDDQIIDLGEMIELNAKGSQGTILWMPSSSVNCSTCRITQAFPNENTIYSVHLTDNNGCEVSDEVMIRVGGVIRVPNSFTPNGDGNNDLFRVSHLNITTFQLEIFNRWGELIFKTNDLEESWDGTYKGKTCKVDTYIWKVTYSHLSKSTIEKTGHVNLVR